MRWKMNVIDFDMSRQPVCERRLQTLGRSPLCPKKQTFDVVDQGCEQAREAWLGSVPRMGHSGPGRLRLGRMAQAPRIASDVFGYPCPYSSTTNKKTHIAMGAAPNIMESTFAVVRSSGCRHRRIIATGTATSSTRLESRATNSKGPAPRSSRLEDGTHHIIRSA